MDLFNQGLTVDRLKEVACMFCGRSIHVGIVTGPVLGNKIERVFLRLLEEEAEYWVPTGKAHCDIPHLDADIKALQILGKRGGAAKIHGYSKGGPPNYHILIFTYSYDGGQTADIHNAHWIPSGDITWVRAEHYLFSVADRHLEKWKLP